MNASLSIKRVPIASLVLDPRNARLHDDRNLAAITASLRQFGQAEPLVVQASTRRVIGGNGRVAAMKALAWTECDTVELDLDDRQATALAIALNRTAELASWDQETLADLLRELEEDGTVDVQVTGFSAEDVEALFREAYPEEPPPVEEATVTPVLLTPVSRAGDLWILGEHRLLCGDSRSKDSVDLALDGRQVDLLWTDPPYGVAYTGGTDEQLTIANDRPEDLLPVLQAAFAEADRVMRPGAPFYIAHPAGALSLTFGRVVTELGWLLHETLVWAKDSLVLGHSDYHYRHEPILYGWKRGEKRPWFAGRDRCSIIECPRPKSSKEHPTMKPVQLVAELIANSSMRGAVVYDPFCGSGSTLLACEHLDRRGVGIEIDGRYCDVVLDRWQKASGQFARLHGTEQTFGDVATERRTHEC